jgi:5-methylcytosine-specific restriction protein A
MNAPVIPERRKPLTRKQRVDAHDRHGGKCCVCLEPIAPGEPFIDEHVIPLELGGSNDESNRGIAHIPCAKIKTRRDQNMIAKAIRMRAKHLGIKKRASRKIPSRGFPKQIST